MRRLVAMGLVLSCAAVVLVAGTGSGGAGTYQVRAIFDSAFSVIPGEDVKIAGVKVGKIDSLDVTSDEKAAIVLDITQPGFADFRADATCTIRPQSLIGEKFVECTPTQPRPAGQREPPALQRIAAGHPGAGQYLLPVAQTIRPVDLDLINNILRLPFRQRLSIILNELGTGLAGRGQDLRQVILRADPALAQTDRVLSILARQNHALSSLSRNSDTVLAPLARARNHVGSFVVGANVTAQAAAQRGSDLQRNIALLPRFLRQLRPTMVRLGALSDQATPVLADLGLQAPAISRFILELGPFSRSATPALVSLGSAADVGRPALIKARPIITDLRTLARTGRPLAANLAALTTSLHDSGGVERLMDYLFYQVGAINGFDSFGHYLRAALLVNLCSTYSITPDPSGSCQAKFRKSSGASASTASSGLRRSPFLARESAALHGARVPRVGRYGPSLGRVRSRRAGAAPRGVARQGALALPPNMLPGGGPSGPGGPAGSGATGPAGPPAASRASSSGGASGALLDYLLGNG